MPATAVLRKKALVRGPLGGSRNWTVLWAVLTGARLLRRLAQDKPDIVFRQVLEPGEAFVIRAGDEPVTVAGATEVKRKR
jgi:hypothetical protein